MKAGTRFINTQLVWVGDKSHDNGTEFVVADKPAAEGKPVQVDVATALGWQRCGWVELAKAEKPKA